MTYDLERAKITESGGNGFWLQGGGVDLSVPVYRQWSVTGSLIGEHASNIQPGIDLSKISYLAGPRYTFNGSRLIGRSPTRNNLDIFGEALFGVARAFDGTFPMSGGATPTANSFALHAGGGIDLAIHKGFGLRAFEVDYVRTGLPNNGSNTQNDLRLAFGLSYRFRTRQ